MFFQSKNSQQSILHAILVVVSENLLEYKIILKENAFQNVRQFFFNVR